MNAPSVLTFTLPENHDFVTFRSLVGLDNNVDNAPTGTATVEFRVFTEDPAPNNDADVTLDLALFGYDENDKVAVTDLWTGKKEGEFSGREFSSFLREHGSSLYRLSTLNRDKASSVSLIAEEDENGTVILKATVNDPTSGASFVQFECDGHIIGSAKVDDNNVATLEYKAEGGTHNYKAYYSGTLDSKNSESSEVSLFTAGIEKISQNTGMVTVIPGNGNITVTAPAEIFLPIYSIDGIRVKSVKADTTPLLVNLEAGIYIIDGNSYRIN